MKRPLAAGVVLVAALGARALAADTVPAYAVPGGAATPPLAPRLDAAAAAAVASVLDPVSQDDAEDGVRTLAALGAGAVPRIAAALRPASWSARAALVSALAEMSDPSVTPLLEQACGDPSFAVREAAVCGLGKWGDARGAAALAARASAAGEASWRVRAAAATALRRAALRGVFDRNAAEAALTALLDDGDEDVRHAALAELAPLAADAALAPILAIFEAPDTPAFERTAALTALRAYRTPSPALLAALRRGFLDGDEAASAIEAGRALLAIRGVAALDDPEIADGVVHRLSESDHEALRDGLARLGKAAAPWIAGAARALAERVASGRAVHETTSFDELLDTLIQVDEAAGLAFSHEVLAGGEGHVYDRATRLAVLHRVQLVYASELGAELRVLFDGRDGEGLRPELLRTIVAGGGDDLAERLDAALGSATTDVRSAALELLDLRPDLPAGERLLTLAREAADPALRRAALETLSRRDPAGAARIAAALLDSPRAELREKAITVLSASRDPADFDRLVERVAREDGADSRPPSTEAGEGATTPSEHGSRTGAARRRILRGLIPALRTCGGARARPTLVDLAEKDTDAAVREAAARSLRGIATAEDAARLVAAEADEPDPNTRRAFLATLATLGSAPEAEARFAALLANGRTRTDALALLGEPGASVVPAGLAAGLSSTEWNDDERVRALRTLDRAGRSPDPETLAGLVSDASRLELCDAACASLGGSPAARAATLLTSLLGTVKDSERLACVVQYVGARRAPEAEAALVELFARTQEGALAARYAADPALELYARTAEAVAEFGSDRTGAALVAHLFDPRLAHAVARARAAHVGFRAAGESAPVVVVHTLVAALARRDDATLRRLLAAEIAARAADGRDASLPEAYLASVARFLREPLAYELPARPRSSSGALLWDLVLRTAPTRSDLDLRALDVQDDELAEARRFADAADALTRLTSLLDVENAARSREERDVLAARVAARRAQAAAVAGDAAGARAIADGIRAADPASGELAYRQGWCYVRIGFVGREAEASLSFAAAQDDRDARVAFYLGYVTETLDGAARALPLFEQAVALDRQRVEERSGEEVGPGHGALYETAAYAYWYARALAAAGRRDLAQLRVTESIALDDRLAAAARTEPVFRDWPELEAAVAAGLARIRPTRRR